MSLRHAFFLMCQVVNFLTDSFLLSLEVHISLFSANFAHVSAHRRHGIIATPSLLHFFYRAALNTERSSREKGARLSVRLYLKHVDCDKKEEKSAPIFIPYEISFSLFF